MQSTKSRPGQSLRSILCLSFLAILPAIGWAQSFTLSVSPSTVTIHPGDQNVPLAVTAASSTYSGPIIVTLTGLPSGISVQPVTVSPGSSGTLELSASVSADQEAFPAAGPWDANSATTTVTAVGMAGTIQASTPLNLVVSLSNPAYAPQPKNINLPIVTINTNGAPIANTNTYIPGTITITSADGQTSFLPNASDSDNTGGFKIHGNTTAFMPKVPYAIKLNTSLDLLHTMGLNCSYVTSSGKATCDKSKSYVLLANYDDKTFLRDWAASALANAIPIGNGYLDSPAGSPSPSGTSTLMPWAPHSLFVELYLNGVYEGNYQLIEKVKVDSHRVNINELSETDTAPADVTGGYFMEIDQHSDEAYVFTTPQGLPIGLKDPDFSPDPEVPEQTNYISNYVDTAENALFSSNFTDPTLGWRAYFDEASAVNFYIVNDVMGNVDGGDFYSSDYLYKDANNPLLYMGPVWDFDISSGNTNAAAIVNPTVPWMQQQAAWYARWFQDPGFKADVVTQWNALKNNGVFKSWLASIGQQASALQQSQANNFGRWPMQSIKVWPNPQAAGSYNGEVAYLTEWLNMRIAYLDSVFNNKQQTTTAMTASSQSLRYGSPLTLSATVTGGTAPTGSVAFLSQNILVGEAELGSDSTASLTTTSIPTGMHNVEAVYNGDDHNALSASSTTSVNVLSPLVSTAVALTSSVSTVNPQTPATLTVQVIGNSGTSVPTGTVSFTANGQALGSAPLTGGVATFSPTQLPNGNAAIQAVYSGDSIYQTSVSNTVTLAVEAIPAPVLSPPAGAYPYEQTVSITDPMPGVTIYYTADGTAPTTASAVYSGPITITSTATLNAIAAIANYSPSAVSSGTFTIIPAPSATVLTSSAQTINVGQSVTLTATVTSTFGTPSGTVTFTNGSTLLGTETLANGTAALTTAALPTGTITVTANYAGDGRFAASSGSVNVTVNPPSFSLQVNPSSLSITRGQTGTATLTVVPVGGYNGMVTVACSNVPANTLCTLSENSIQLNGDNQPAEVTLTIKTDAGRQVAEAGSGPMRGSQGPLFPALIFWWPGSVLGLGAFRRRRQRSKPGSRWLGICVVLMMVGALAGSLSGCGDGGSTTPLGSSAIKVIATTEVGSPPVVTSATLSVTVTR